MRLTLLLTLAGCGGNALPSGAPFFPPPLDGGTDSAQGGSEQLLLPHAGPCDVRGGGDSAILCVNDGGLPIPSSFNGQRYLCFYVTPNPGPGLPCFGGDGSYTVADCSQCPR